MSAPAEESADRFAAGPPPRSRRPEGGAPGVSWTLGLALAALALAARWLSWERTAVLFNDGPRFLRQAESILAGDWAAAFAEPYHPLYAVFTAAVASLGPELERSAAAVSILAGSAAVVALYWLLNNTFGAPYDWLGALLAATHARAIEFSSDIQSEGLYCALFLLAVGLSWRALERSSTRHAFAAGLAASLAFWTRPEGIGVALLAAGLAPWWAWRRRWGVSHAARWLGALGIASALGVGSYAVALHTATGEWRVTQKKSLLRGAAVAPAAPRDAVRSQPPALRTLHSRGPKTWGASLEDLSSTARSAARPLVLVGLGLSLVALRGRLGPRGVWLLGVAAGYLVLLMWLLLHAGYVSRRHILPPLLPLFGYAAVGLTALWTVTGDRLRPLRRLAAPAPLLVGAMLLLPFLIQPRRIDKLAEREAAQWLATQPSRGASETVAGIGGRIGYYAKRPMLDFRGVGAEELPDAFVAHGVGFAISDRPEWITALSGDPRFERVHESVVAGNRAWVFARRPPREAGAGGSD